MSTAAKHLREGMELPTAPTYPALWERSRCIWSSQVILFLQTCSKLNQVPPFLSILEVCLAVRSWTVRNGRIGTWCRLYTLISPRLQRLQPVHGINTHMT